MDLGLTGRTALITGGSKGIGKASAWSLAREGCNIHIASRTEADLEQAKQDITSRFNVSVTIHPTDLSDGDAARALIGACEEVDILVNNAGAIPAGDIHSVDEPRWREAWDLKVFGYINTCRAMLDIMKARGHGVIVNVIGAAGEKPTAGYIAGFGCGKYPRRRPRRGYQSGPDRNGTHDYLVAHQGRGRTRRSRALA